MDYQMINNNNNMIEEDIVIVGAGIAGLATSLGLHRMGLKSLVLESWENLRVTGFAFTTFTNAWKALDALGIGDTLREQHILLQGPQGHEIRCVGRKVLLETLANELPQGTIRFCSKVVSIEEQGHAKLIHLADGSVIKTKVLIGCDGVNLVVAKWLGLQEPVFAGRTSIRGHAVFKENEGHCFGPTFLQIFGDGCRSEEADSINTKQYMVMKLGKAPKEVIDIIEKTDPKSIVISPLRFRWPSSILFGSISKANVCVAGDALHPMTPDIGQGANAALEDGVVLARCLSQALLLKATDETAEYNNINTGLAKYAKERRWRSFELASTSYIVGVLQQGSMFIKFIRDKFLSPYLAGMLLKRAEFDCGKLDT